MSTIMVLLIFVPMVHSEKEKSMNDYVMQIVKSFPLDGTYKYSWPKKSEGKDPYDGVTQDIYYQGEKIMRGDGNKDSYCCGLTLEIYLKAVNKYNLSNESKKEAVEHSPAQYVIMNPIKGLDTTNFSNFKYLWFCPNFNSEGPGEALTSYGMGTIVKDWNQAEAGDFIQLWRWNKSGHSAIFINWVKDSTGNITGFKYWSSQGQGIGYRTEYFGDSGRSVDRKRFFLARLTEPDTWK